jgi:hypothetical protein
MEYMFGKTVISAILIKLGDKYEGEWYQSYKHGRGTDYFANGEMYTGQYNFGNPVVELPQTETPDPTALAYGSSPNEYVSKSSLNIRNKSLPHISHMRPEKGNLMDEQRKSFIEMKVYNSDFSSADYEYSGYDTQQNDQHEALIKQYNKILSKRFPNSKSEENSMHHTPIREVIRKQNKNKYNFHIPAHLRSKSKEFLAPQNRDG